MREGAAITAAMPSSVRDRVYDARGGFIYTSEHLVAADTVRPWAVVLISARGQPHEVRQHAQVLHGEAFAIRPLTPRSLRAPHGGLVSINLHPTHPAYRAFMAIGTDGLLPLQRRCFGHLDDELNAACLGLLSRRQGAVLFERLVDATLPQLPGAPPPHAMAPAIVTFLEAEPAAELTDLAVAFGLSYSRMSHVFKEATGLSFRVFQSALRMRRAGREFSREDTLTGIAHAAGFTDSAHLSHSWRRCYGMTPSYVRNDHWVQVVA
jgi:AraC-like DNA-binding protein